MRKELIVTVHSARKAGAYSMMNNIPTILHHLHYQLTTMLSLRIVFYKLDMFH